MLSQNSFRKWDLGDWTTATGTHGCPWMICGPYDEVEELPCDTRSFISQTLLLSTGSKDLLWHRGMKRVSQSHLVKWQIIRDLWHSTFFFHSRKNVRPCLNDGWNYGGTLVLSQIPTVHKLCSKCFQWMDGPRTKVFTHDGKKLLS